MFQTHQHIVFIIPFLLSLDFALIGSALGNTFLTTGLVLWLHIFLANKFNAQYPAPL
jgi:hypothetical protein